jgi:hypothetical protein
MKLIPLTQGQFAKVDDEDFTRFQVFKWHAAWRKHTKDFCAARNSPRDKNGNQKTILLHREVVGVTDSKIMVDHKNHNSLDCQRNNLRACTNAQNVQNRSGLSSNNTSGFRGVYWNASRGKWWSKIVVCRKSIFLGRFSIKEEAVIAYAAANKKFFGEFGGLS